MYNNDIENPMLGGYQQQQQYPYAGQQMNQYNGQQQPQQGHHHHHHHNQNNQRKESSSSSSSDSNQQQQQNDYEDGSSLSNNKFLRSGFVSKVYSILTVQMVCTVFFCAISMSSESFRTFQLNSFGLLIFAFVLSIICMLVLICSRDQARKVPNNYILLGLFTFAEAYIVSFICGFSNPRIVFMAAFFTMAVFFSLTLYACTTKTDFTLMGGSLAIFGMIMLVFALFMMFTDSKIMEIIYSALASVLFGLYILYDTQLIIGTKSLKYSIDDYIIASLELYSDIIGLFLQILSLLQNLSGSSE